MKVVQDFIAKHKLLKTNGVCIVGLSGGADSVALLLMLGEMGYNVHAAHCNFKLRGAESERDEQFCATLCEQRNIPFHRIHFDTFTYAEVHKVSIELAARELRYRWFEQLRQDIGAEAICIAHHRDDSVETVLMNLVRGTGVRGLAGIKPRNGMVVRPLLCLSRKDIEAYLAEKKQPFVVDSTNLEDHATRNKVRHHLIPLLSELNGKALENIQRMTERMAGMEQFIDAYRKTAIEKVTARGVGARYVIAEEKVQNAYVLYELIRDWGFNSFQAEKAFACLQEGQTGRLFSSASHDMLTDRHRILIEPSPQPLRILKMPEPGMYVIGPQQRLRVSIAEKTVSKSRIVATADLRQVRFPLTIRPAAEGDRLVPFGMKGSKLVSDLLTDLHMSLFDKRRQLVITDADGGIVWLPGVRIADRVAVADDTEQVLVMEWLTEDEETF